MRRVTQRAQELVADVTQNMPGRHSQTREEFQVQGVFSTRSSKGHRRVTGKDLTWQGQGVQRTPRRAEKHLSRSKCSDDCSVEPISWHTQKMLSERRQEKKSIYYVIVFMEKARKCKLSHSGRQQNGDLGMDAGRATVGGIIRSTRKLSGGVEGSFTSVVVMVSPLHAYVKTYQMAHFRHYIALHVNHTSIELLKENTLEARVSRHGYR